MERKLVVLILLLCGCVASKPRYSKWLSFDDASKQVQSVINTCLDATSDLDLHMEYNVDSLSYVVYQGASSADAVKKWVLPLDRLDEEGISLTLLGVGGFKATVRSAGDENVIEYYKGDRLESRVSEFNYYLTSCYKTEEDLINFVYAFRDAIHAAALQREQEGS